MDFIKTFENMRVVPILSKCGVEELPTNSSLTTARFLDKVKDGDVILADRRFDIADDLGICGSHLDIASFTRGKRLFGMQKWNVQRSF